MNNVSKFRQSVRFAYEGIKYALATQQNMKFHFFAAFFILIAALIVNLSKIEILFMLLSITLVIIMELVNTAVEKVVDLAMPDRHPLAKIAKDVAAAAVLVSAVFAAVVGMVIFYEPIDKLISQIRHYDPISAATIWVMIALVAITLIMIQTAFSQRTSAARPSLISAVAFSASIFVAWIATQTIVILLCYALTFLLMMVLYEKTNRSFVSLIYGALIGSVITLTALYIIHYW